MLLKLALITALLTPSLSRADDAICIDSITAKATAEEKANIGKLLQQIAFRSEEDPRTHTTVQRVIRVDAGSVYERSGIKAGDVITTGCSR